MSDTYTDGDFQFSGSTLPAASRTLLLLNGTLAATILCLGGTCVGLYRLASVVSAEADARDRRWQEFHAQMTYELRDLARSVDLATSTDLSPVRFRFRTESFTISPMKDAHFTLTCPNRPQIMIQDAMYAVNDCGLLPPGEYHLRAEADVYELDWDFTIHPGAPFDRVLVVPNFVPETARLEICRGESERPVPGVCLLKGRFREMEGLPWKLRQPLALVADHRLSDEMLSELITSDAELLSIMMAEDLEVRRSIPFFEADVLRVHALVDSGGTVAVDLFAAPMSDTTVRCSSLGLRGDPLPDSLDRQSCAEGACEHELPQAVNLVAGVATPGTNQLLPAQAIRWNTRSYEVQVVRLPH